MSSQRRKHSEETRKRMSEAQKGHIVLELTRNKLSHLNLGKKLSEETKQKISNKMRGKQPFVMTKEIRDKISKTKKGKYFGNNNPNWKGGFLPKPYPQEFNKELKQKIRERDNYTCCLCSKTEREELEELNRVLCVNHIDFNKQNYKENNLNTLCCRCNVKINRDREFWTDYFNQV